MQKKSQNRQYANTFSGICRKNTKGKPLSCQVKTAYFKRVLFYWLLAFLLVLSDKIAKCMCKTGIFTRKSFSYTAHTPQSGNASKWGR